MVLLQSRGQTESSSVSQLFRGIGDDVRIKIFVTVSAPFSGKCLPVKTLSGKHFLSCLDENIEDFVPVSSQNLKAFERLLRKSLIALEHDHGRTLKLGWFIKESLQNLVIVPLGVDFQETNLAYAEFGEQGGETTCSHLPHLLLRKFFGEGDGRPLAL